MARIITQYFAGGRHDGNQRDHPARPLSREPATALEWRQLAAWIKRNFADRLNAREHQFVTHMATWRAMPSAKQQEWLNAIAEQFGEVAA